MGYNKIVKSRIKGMILLKLLNVSDVLALNRDSLKDKYKEYINPELAKLLGLLKLDKCFVKAQGASVWDSDGNEYLDFLGGYGATSLGHNPPEVISAVMEVLDNKTPNILQVSMGVFASALAENLAKITPGELKYSFFGNSGAEAVEGALKTARAATGKTLIISTEGSFHGKTFGALSASGRDKYKKPFLPMVPDFEQVPYGDTEVLEVKFKQKDVCAFIVEPIQGEAGVIIPPEGYLKKVRELCSKYNVLLIIDEIQTGFARTGKMFACELEDVAPDIMTLSKSLGGSLIPVSAFVCTEKVWKKAYGSADRCLLHTSTFGGNSIACAAGIAAINSIIAQDLPKQAEEKGQYFMSKLLAIKEKHKIIKEIRGKGLLIGMEFNQPTGIANKLAGNITYEYLASMVVGILQNKHRIITAYTLNNPNVIRFEPPLIVSYQQIDKVISALDNVFTENRNIFNLALTSAKAMFSIN